MKDEFLILNKKQVGIIKALNSVHKFQNFDAWTIKGYKGYYLYKEFQTKEGIPQDFQDYFNTLKATTIKDVEIQLINMKAFNTYKFETEIRAASNAYDLSQLPKNIYHYTGSKGVLGIITTQKIWATHYSFLNDYNEFEYAKDLIRKILEEILDNSEFQNTLKENWHLFEAQFKYYNTFLVSFSTEKDLLSQWRGYSNHGKGYSLGFETKVIGLATLPKERSQTFTIRPVLYDKRKQKQIIKEAIDYTLKEIYKNLEQFGSPYHYSLEFYKLLHWNCLLPIVTFKSEHFKEECEWRAIHMQDDFDKFSTENLKIRFKTNLENIIPYVELDLNSEVGDQSERFPLREIVYGPTLADDLAEKSLELLTKKLLKKKINIQRSKLTLR